MEYGHSFPFAGEPVIFISVRSQRGFQNTRFYLIQRIDATVAKENNVPLNGLGLLPLLSCPESQSGQCPLGE